MLALYVYLDLEDDWKCLVYRQLPELCNAIGISRSGATVGVGISANWTDP